jgi:hypothetical protein
VAAAVAKEGKEGVEAPAPAAAVGGRRAGAMDATDRTPARARMTSSKWPPPLAEAAEGPRGAEQASRKRCGGAGKRPRAARDAAGEEDGQGQGWDDQEEEEGAGEARAGSGSEAAGTPSGAPRVRLVCALLNDLPARGTFTNVTRETCDEYSKRSRPMATHLPNYDTLHPKCRTVKNDETNILVRALKIKKRNELRRKREARGQGERPVAATGEPEVGARSGDDAEGTALATPRASRGPRRPRQDSFASTPVVATPAVPAEGAAAAAVGSSSSSSSSSGIGSAGLSVQAASPLAPASDGAGLRVLCAFSPRLGASRVRTPPPTNAHDAGVSTTPAHE